METFGFVCRRPNELRTNADNIIIVITIFLDSWHIVTPTINNAAVKIS